MLIMRLVLNSQALLTFIVFGATHATLRLTPKLIMLVLLGDSLMILLLLILLLIRLLLIHALAILTLTWVLLIMIHIHAKLRNLLHLLLTLSHFACSHFLQKLSRLHTCIHLAEEETENAFAIFPFQIIKVDLVTAGLLCVVRRWH